MKIWPMALVPLACMMIGCGGDDDDDGGKDAGLEEESCFPVNYLAWCEEGLPETAKGAEKDFCPMVDGAVWRYREQTADFANPPPPEVGTEMTLRHGEGNQWTLMRRVVRDVLFKGETVRAVQTTHEVFEVTEPESLVGSVWKLSRFEVEERRADDNHELIRTLTRVYDPAFTVISDSWHVGEFGTSLSYDDVSLNQVETIYGGEEPEVRNGEGKPTISVEVSTTPATLPMEGQYRENVFRVNLYDDFLGQLNRSYWLQKGVGPVQWISRDSSNVTYTLMTSTLE